MTHLLTYSITHSITCLLTHIPTPNRVPDPNPNPNLNLFLIADSKPNRKRYYKRKTNHRSNSRTAVSFKMASDHPAFTAQART